MPGVDLAETKYNFVAELRNSDIHRHCFPVWCIDSLALLRQLFHPCFLAALLTLTQNDKSQDFFFCECEVGMCVLSRFWVASVLRGNSHDIANILESHAVTSTLSHHVVLSQWEGNFTWSGILLQVLQCVLQTLFLHFIPCVILVSPRKSFITNSICSENYFPFKQPKPVG